MDLVACIPEDELIIPPHETVKISVGIATEFDEEYAALILPRSGLSTKQSLAPINSPGLIDSDYRGEWFVPLHNYSNIEKIVYNGDRIAQAVFIIVERPEVLITTELNETERGSGGFGSTGK